MSYMVMTCHLLANGIMLVLMASLMVQRLRRNRIMTAGSRHTTTRTRPNNPLKTAIPNIGNPQSHLSGTMASSTIITNTMTITTTSTTRTIITNTKTITTTSTTSTSIINITISTPGIISTTNTMNTTNIKTITISNNTMNTTNIKTITISNNTMSSIITTMSTTTKIMNIMGTFKMVTMSSTTMKSMSTNMSTTSTITITMNRTGTTNIMITTSNTITKTPEFLNLRLIKKTIMLTTPTI
ncbi:hypothetical protein BGZ96_004632 [Linnemannia gamsii]|uniref:Uncharacterized protein n=1 Tax=Linnemannia gamsii TaxID=64522 RepID=A0ABQ7K6M5_9FUNG|nr:hypothetical protein BGZ96_004632 [Linnemannia gamsii]